MRSRCVLIVYLLFVSTCGPTGNERGGREGDDLPLGQLEPADGSQMKDDSQWGAATTCKAIPVRTPLAAPRITISLDGLTLHLVDAKSGFSRVYPIGPGAINHRPGELTYDRSLTMYPLLATGKRDFTIRTASVNPCKIWWTDPDTGKRSPVFAGLPFLSFYGNYGIHGPITGFTAPSGGRLQRGYVSHGCVRMEAADVAELWALVRQVPSVPVRLQEEIERAADGRAVDIPQRWLLSECALDGDCNYGGGVCLSGFCAARCSGLCNYDKYGYPVSFCVADPAASGQGFCTLKSSDFNASCRRYRGFRSVAGAARFTQPAVRANVCLPAP